LRLQVIPESRVARQRLFISVRYVLGTRSAVRLLRMATSLLPARSGNGYNWGMTTSYAKELSPPKTLDWRKRLALINETKREIRPQTDPEVISKTYSSRMRQLLPLDGFIALSRRELSLPAFRNTRSSRWTEEINPWKQRDRLPLLRGGLLGEL